MNFLCPSCNGRFDIGVPPGVTIPCPACGAMLKPAEEGGAEAEAEEQPAEGGGSLLDEILTGWGDEGGAGEAAAASATEEPSLADLEAGAAEPAAAFERTAPAGFATAPAGVGQPGAEDQAGFADFAQAIGEAAAEPEQAPAAPALPPRSAQVTKPLLESVGRVDTVDVLKPKGFPLAGPAPAPAKASGLAWFLFVVAVLGCGGLAAVVVLFNFRLSRAGKQRETFRVAAAESKQEERKAIKQLDEAERKIRELLRDIGEEKEGLDKKADGIAEAEKKAEERAAVRAVEAEKVAKEALAERDKAVAARDRALERERRTRESLAAAVKVSRALGIMSNPRRLSEAEALLTESIESGYDGPEARLWRGRVRMKLRKPEKAVDDFLKADEVNRAGVMSQALLYAGDVCRTMLGDPEKAKEHYRRAARGKGGHSLVAGARHAEVRNELDEALRRAGDAVKKVPDLWEARLALADIHARKVVSGSASGYTEENLKAVAGEFDMAAKLNPLLARALAAKADFLFDVYLVTKDKSLLTAADREAQRAGDVEPGLSYAQFVRSRTKIALGTPREALGILETVLEEEPWRSRAWVDRGSALLALGKTEQAGASFDKALKLDKNSALAHLGFARVYLKLKKFDDALTALKTVVSVRPEWPEGHLLLAYYYLHVPGRLDARKAKTSARRALSMTGGKDIRAIHALASSFFVLKERDDAAKYIEIGLAIDPRYRPLVKLREQLRGY